MRCKLSSSLVFLSVLLIAAGAGAATIFDLTGTPGSDFQYRLSQDSITLRVFGVSSQGLERVHRGPDGMGVYAGLQDEPGIENRGPDEALLLAFSVPVEVYAADLSRDGQHRWFDSPPGMHRLGDQLYAFLGGGPAYQVRQIAVGSPGPAMPEPGAALVFAAGLLVARFAGRRR